MAEGGEASTETPSKANRTRSLDATGSVINAKSGNDSIKVHAE
jgi:hypothetical protein